MSSPNQHPVAPDDDTRHESPNASKAQGKERLYTPQTNERPSYKYFLDLLDFKPVSVERRNFEFSLRRYHKSPHRRYLRKEDGHLFTALVNGFLKQHGATYFGDRHRSHLVKSDPTVGLFYHGDAETDESHLWRTLADFFHWRSSCAMGGKHSHKGPIDAKRPIPSSESSREEASEDDRAQRHRRRSKPEPESQQDSSVRKDYDNGRRRLRKRIFRLPIGQEVSDGHQSKHPRTEGQGQDQGQRSNIHHHGSPSSHQSDNDLRHHERNPTSPAQSSGSTLSPEAPDIPSRRASQATVVDLTTSDGKEIKPEPLDANTAAGAKISAVLPTNILTNTNLLVRVSNQPNIAPACVNLRLCRDIEALFPVLIAECDVQASSAMKVTKISVTFPWNREELRLRRGRREDWVMFCQALRQRWDKSEVVDGGTCKVEMVVHVDV